MWMGPSAETHHQIGARCCQLVENILAYLHLATGEAKVEFPSSVRVAVVVKSSPECRSFRGLGLGLDLRSSLLTTVRKEGGWARRRNACLGWRAALGAGLMPALGGRGSKPGPLALLTGGVEVFTTGRTDEEDFAVFPPSGSPLSLSLSHDGRNGNHDEKDEECSSFISSNSSSLCLMVALTFRNLSYCSRSDSFF